MGKLFTPQVWEPEPKSPASILNSSLVIHVCNIRTVEEFGVFTGQLLFSIPELQFHWEALSENTGVRVIEKDSQCLSLPSTFTRIHTHIQYPLYLSLSPPHTHTERQHTHTQSSCSNYSLALNFIHPTPNLFLECWLSHPASCLLPTLTFTHALFLEAHASSGLFLIMHSILVSAFVSVLVSHRLTVSCVVPSFHPKHVKQSHCKWGSPWLRTMDVMLDIRFKLIFPLLISGPKKGSHP